MAFSQAFITLPHLLFSLFVPSHLLKGLTWPLLAVPPSPPEVRDSGGFPLGDTVGPYDEGESMAITCLAADSGSPPPKLTW